MPQFEQGFDATIIGAGPAGIAMAYQLRHRLGFRDFIIYEKLDGVGGTWRTNTYPGWYGQHLSA
jgi:cation diffusion facilitator CzcD-associated flavoprotein CzcO